MPRGPRAEGGDRGLDRDRAGGPNEPNDNITLHRIRRPFGKPAFALGPDGSLEIRGSSPVPRYPPCSAWVLSETYEPTRVDGPGHRALKRLASPRPWYR